MAGLIARLTGRKAPKTPWDPALAGMGGARQGPGPYGADGYPGSTSATRTLKGAAPRDIGLRADSNVGFDQGFGGVQTRQGGRPFTEGWENPRDTEYISTPEPRTISSLRVSSAEWYGGQALKSSDVSPANHVVGQNPLMGAAGAGGHSTYDTETPRTSRQPDISGGVPGSANVRNDVALRYKEAPAGFHSYQSAPRPDQNPKVLGESGAGGGAWSYTTPVTVPNRYKWQGPSGGVQTWSVNRQMPYTGRGDGARGGDLNGTRYYAEGPPAFIDAGQGQYGIARLIGDKTKRPVSFTEPAPWTSQFYDTTESAGTADAPGPGGQAPAAVYVSPDPGRAGINSTGRR